MTAPREPVLEQPTSEPGWETDSLVRAVAAAPALAVHEGGVRLAHGELVDGLFEIRRTLGQGGMGAVYEAYDRDLDRTVALKLHRSVGRDSVLRRMRAEARAMARVIHPNVLTVHAVGLHRGSLYIAMEFAAGGTLRRWLQEPRSVAEIVAVFAEAGRGLAAAHRAGIVHRDFKPDNVLLDDRGVAKVADFGLANELVSAERQPTLTDVGDDRAEPHTHSHSLAGTPAYMPPEQLRGESLDPRTDQFAFCVALFEALCGALPFEVQPLETLADRIDAGALVAVTPRDPGPELRRVVRRGLRPRPAERFADIDELVDAMLRAADAPRRRRTRRWTLAGLVATTAAVGVSIVALRPEPSEPSDPCARAAAAIDELWGPTRAAALGDAYAGSELGVETWAHVRGSLADYVDAWKQAREQTCSAGLHEGATASAKAGEACLDSARRDLAVLLERLERVDDDAIVHAVEWTHGLVAPSDCLERERLAPLVSRPSDPATRAQLEQLEDDMRRLRRDILELGNQSPREYAEALVERADALAYDPTRALATRMLAGMLERDGDIEGSRAATRAAFDLAVAGGDWREAMREAIMIAQSHGRYQTELERADEWLETARTLASRVDDLGLAAMLASTSAMVASARGDVDATEAGFSEAVALQRAADPDNPALCKYLANAGIAAMIRGDVERSRTLLEEALATTIRILGPRHPDVAHRLMQLGTLEVKASRPVVARERFVAALELLGDRKSEAVSEFQLLQGLHAVESQIGNSAAAREYARKTYDKAVIVYPPNHPNLFGARINYADAVAEDGDPELAKQLFQEAIDSRAADDPELASAYLMLSHVHRTLDEHAGAIAAATRAIELNADPQWAARCYYARADAHAEAGHASLAIADFERGFAVQPDGMARTSYNDARWVYATLLVDVRGRRDEAVTIARESLAYFSDGDAPNPGLVEAITAWLEAHAN